MSLTGVGPTVPVAVDRTGPTRRAYALLALLAALPRLCWALLAAREPVGLFDPQIYLAAARSIAAGDGYRSLTGTVTAYYPPGYPFFLGTLQWLANLVGLGDHVFTLVALVQAVIGSATVLGVTLLASRVLSARGAVLAGGIAAVWPNLVLHSSLLLSETLFNGLFVAAVLLTVLALEREGRRSYYLLAPAGVVTGLALATRPQAAFVLFPAVLIALLWARAGWRRTLTVLCVLLLGSAVVLTPWGARNRLRMGSVVLISTNTGDNICIGFNDEASGGFGMPAVCQTEQAYTDGPAAEVARDAQLRGATLRWVRHNLHRLPALSAAKLRITFAGDHDALIVAESFGRDRFLAPGLRTTLRLLSDGYYWVVVLMAVASVPLLLGRSRGPTGPRIPTVLLLTLVTLGALVPVASFGDQRFKVPLEPFLAILAAVTLLAAAQSFLRPGSKEDRSEDG